MFQTCRHCGSVHSLQVDDRDFEWLDLPPWKYCPECGGEFPKIRDILKCQSCGYKKVVEEGKEEEATSTCPECDEIMRRDEEYIQEVKRWWPDNAQVLNIREAEK